MGESMSVDDSDTLQSGLNCDHPVADRLNSDCNWSGNPISPAELLKRYVGDNQTIGGDRPHVLNHQIPAVAGEALLTQVPLSVLYRYRRDDAYVTAWQIDETAQALLRDDRGGHRPPRYMLPYLGESVDDLFWLLCESRDRGIEFQIEYLDTDVTESILSMMRPQYRASAEILLSAPPSR